MWTLIFAGACTGDALSYVWIGPNKASVASAGASTTPSGGQLLKPTAATANRVYTNSNNGLTYSSPDIHTVCLQTVDAGLLVRGQGFRLGPASWPSTCALRRHLNI